jgi:hypothetical protein
MPRAIPGGGLKISTKRKVRAGRRTHWLKRPVRIDPGCLARAWKFFGDMDRATPNMMKARQRFRTLKLAGEKVREILANGSMREVHR